MKQESEGKGCDVVGYEYLESRRPAQDVADIMTKCAVGYPWEGERKKKRERGELTWKEREVKPDNQKDHLGAAGQESVELRSWVEPEDQCDDDIQAYQDHSF